MSLTKIPEPSSHFPQSKSGKADGVYKINSPRFPIAGEKKKYVGLLLTYPHFWARKIPESYSRNKIKVLQI